MNIALSTKNKTLRILTSILQIFFLILCSFGFSNIIYAKNSNSSKNFKKTVNYFDSIKKNDLKLMMFLYDMPKGGNLHSHIDGSIYPEHLIDYALKDEFNYCVDNEYKVTREKKCKNGKQNLNEVKKSMMLENNLIDTWSNRNYNPANHLPSAEHFFLAFDKFIIICKPHFVDFLAESAIRSASNNTSYLELMTSIGTSSAEKLVDKVKWEPNFRNLKNKFIKAGIKEIVDNTSKTVNNYYKEFKKKLKCHNLKNKKPCKIKVRFINSVKRNKPPIDVFVQLLHAFELAKINNLVVGVNLIQAEHYPYSTKDYNLQMEMIGFFRKEYPNVNVSLHAGELSDTIAPPEELKYRIGSAVNIAKTDRVGHAVSIANEKNADQLLKKMAKDKIAVEINLSSNEFILGVKGNKHPFNLYLDYGVPLTINTDDEGLLRTTINHEYFKAIKRYKISYPLVKDIVRNSITYSFIPGENLWNDYNYKKTIKACAKDKPGSKKLSKSCKKFLGLNEKALMQWNLEKSFNDFEEKISTFKN